MSSFFQMGGHGAETQVSFDMWFWQGDQMYQTAIIEPLLFINLL